MPHLSFEYSANLANQTDLAALSQRLKVAAMDSGVFEIGAVRVRGVCCDVYAVADEMPQNAFLHLTISLGAGRSEDARAQAGEVIWTALCDHLAPLFGSPHFALTMEMREIAPGLSWKKNAIHPRLRAQTKDTT